MKKKTIIIVIIALVVLIAGGLTTFFVVKSNIENQEYREKIANQTEIVAEPFSVSFPVPKGSEDQEYYGDAMKKIKSPLSLEETQKFYDDYFATLVKCNFKKGKERVAYYDSSINLIMSDFEVFVDSDTNTTYFLIAYDQVEDINNNEYYEISK